MKKRMLVSALALALGLPMAAHAGVVFNPTGGGAGAGAIDLGQLGWSTTSAVAVGGAAAIANGVNSTFTVLTHARLVDTTDQQSHDNTPTGLNNAYEITMVAGFQEVVTSIGANSATFATTGVGFVEIYFDRSLNANIADTNTTGSALTGHGYNDGTLILRATSDLPGQSGTFLVTGGGAGTNPPACSPNCLDQFGGSNQYPNQASVSGTGSNQDIPVDTITQDHNFFVTTLATFGLDFANISQQLPFRQVNPSDCFTPTVSGVAVGGTVTPGSGPCINLHVLGPYSAQAPDPNGGYLPVTGPVNGLFGSGPDFVFQTRYDASVTPSVPEPGSLALLGLGLAAAGATFARRRDKKN